MKNLIISYSEKERKTVIQNKGNAKTTVICGARRVPKKTGNGFELFESGGSLLTVIAVTRDEYAEIIKLRIPGNGGRKKFFLYRGKISRNHLKLFFKTHPRLDPYRKYVEDLFRQTKESTKPKTHKPVSKEIVSRFVKKINDRNHSKNREPIPVVILLSGPEKRKIREEKIKKSHRYNSFHTTLFREDEETATTH